MTSQGAGGKFFLITGICLSVVPQVAGAIGTESGTNWIVEPIEYAPSDSDRIGPLKAGFVCAPSGNVKWGDIRIPRDNDVSKAALEQLNKIKQAALPPPKAGYRLMGKLEKIDLKLCVAGLGIGEKQPKGRANIEVQWTQLQLTDGSVVRSEKVQTVFEFKGSDPRKDSRPLQDALIENLTKFLEEKR